MRAAFPIHEGMVERDGAHIAYEVYGRDDAPTVALLPSWEVLHSRHWKMTIAYLGRHYRVVTYDPVGNGKSDRVFKSERYGARALLDDALAVLDVTGTDTAIAAGLSMGGGLATLLGAFHPDRVSGVIAIAPSHRWNVPIEDRPPALAKMFEEKHNVNYWRQNWPDFVDFFMSEVASDPFSTKLWDDLTTWGNETEGEIIALGAEGSEQIDQSEVEVATAAMTMPVLIIHGTGDRIISFESAVALRERIPHAELMAIEGAGHAPTGRHPVKINHAIKAFADSTFGRASVSNWESPVHSTRKDARKRALMISSPIGLGHARRDVAICDELRQLHPDLEIDWLAQDPVTHVLRAAGEKIHPASAFMSSETEHIESESGEHDLAAFQALRNMDEIQVANFMICEEVLAESQYDLVIGDESWELDFHLHENPKLKNTAYAWMTDFVGFLPMPERGAREAFVAADYNAEMIDQIARYGSIRDKSIFVGNPEDIVPDRFGPDLPFIREWTEQNYDFAGYVTGFDPRALGERAALRAELGYDSDELICIVAVGGSGVGSDLLRRVADAAPAARRAVEGLRFIVVTGPRIDPASMPVVEGVEYRAFVDRLYRHLACADVAIVQGGLTTTMELAALKVPFIYVPLRNHFEQNFHVRARLDRYHAGIHLDYSDFTPDRVAELIVKQLAGSAPPHDVESHGAARAAALIADLL